MWIEIDLLIMGVQASAHLAINIDNPSIVPGTVVSGTVYLAVNKDRVDAESLILRIVGGEYTCVKYTTSNGKHHHHHQVHGTAIFLDLSYPLALTPGGYFVKGQYEFPFRFCLPQGVLPSMGAMLPGEHGGHCSISYAVEAKLHRKGFFNWDVQHKKEFWVLGPPVAHLPNYPTYIPPIEVPLNFFGCCKRGNVRLGISTDKSVLAAGEQFEVHYVIQNNSTSRMKAMEIDIRENVIWRAQGQTRVLSTNLFHRRLEQNTIGLDISPANQNDTVDVGSLVIQNHDILLHLKNILDSRQFKCPVQIGANARTTTDGNLIDVEHYLVVSIKTPFGTSDPEVTSKITVHRYGIQATPFAVPTGYMQTNTQVPAQLPPNWHAVAQPTANLPVPSYAPPTVYDTPESPHNPDLVAPAPVVRQYKGVQNLFQVMQSSYTPVTEFQKWCEQNPADELSPQDLQIVYQIVKRVIEQLSITEHVLQFRSFITCTHVAAILQVAQDQIKTEIVNKLAKKIVDKENVGMIRDRMTPFQFMCVEQSLK